MPHMQSDARSETGPNLDSRGPFFLDPTPPTGATLRARLLSAFVKRSKAGEVRALLDGDAVVESALAEHGLDLDRLFETIEHLENASPDEFRAALHAVGGPHADELRSFFTWHYRMFSMFDAERVEETRRISAEYFPEGSFEHDFIESNWLCRQAYQGVLPDVTQTLLRLADRWREEDQESLYLRSVILTSAGDTALLEGDHRRAKRAFEEARFISRKNAFLVHFAVVQKLARLLVACAQYEKALKLHQDPTLRAFAKEHGARRWLARSHYEAARCAIEVGDFDTVREELARSSRVYGDDAPASVEACNLIYTACWAQREAHFEDAAARLADARAVISPTRDKETPLLIRVVEAEAHLLRTPPDVEAFTAATEEVLHDAERVGAQNIVDRILFTRSFFGDVPTRAIVNPYRRLRACANEMWRARDEGDSARVEDALDRIESLRPRLIDGVYLETVELAVEKRLPLAGLD